MSNIFENVEPMVHESRINVPYHWWAGDTASRFFVELRDKQKILGTRCSQCEKVFVPPRKTCPTCFTPNEEWKEVASKGTLISYTVVRRHLASLPKKPPIIYGLVKLDGADTALLHILEEINPEDVQIGMKVQAKFSSQRKGTMFDIEYFRPVH
ncbi:MAG: Zn-ribbon domain-containing OB-fold protein [Desulfomonilia bacterium]|nr:Zn-ribbon domain-containing OB-fold protein [Desulfomonilia bacterium]